MMGLVLLAGDLVIVAVEMPVESIEHVAPLEVRHGVAARSIPGTDLPDTVWYFLLRWVQFLNSGGATAAAGPTAKMQAVTPAAASLTDVRSTTITFLVRFAQRRCPSAGRLARIVFLSP
jgi:hypothetical protein